MSNDLEDEKVERIVKRFKAAIKVKNIIKESDIFEWGSSFSSLISDIITFSDKNEFDIYDENVKEKVFTKLSKDNEVSREDLVFIKEMIKRKSGLVKKFVFFGAT